MNYCFHLFIIGQVYFDTNGKKDKTQLIVFISSKTLKNELRQAAKHLHVHNART
jgi:hypothetical protein